MKFVLPMPPGLNSTYGLTRNGGMFKNRIAAEWEELAGWEIKRQRKIKKTYLGEIKLKIKFFYSRDRDVDAGIKILIDLLEKQRIYNNDSQVVELFVTKERDTKYPHAEVEIYET